MLGAWWTQTGLAPVDRLSVPDCELVLDQIGRLEHDCRPFD